jgi:hypothetical protein
MLIDAAISGGGNVIKERNRENFKIWRPSHGNTAYLECKNTSDWAYQ